MTRGIDFDRNRIIQVTLTPSAVAATTSAEQTFTVKGLKLGDVVWINKPSSQAGLGIVGHRVSAEDTLAITYANLSQSPITPTAAENYKVFVIRPDSLETDGAAQLR